VVAAWPTTAERVQEVYHTAKEPWRELLPDALGLLREQRFVELRGNRWYLGSDFKIGEPLEVVPT
jgi:hypothetical protein